MSIEYFVESIRRKPVSTKCTFDKMTLRQKAISMKWLSRRSVVQRSVVYPKRQLQNCKGIPSCNYPGKKQILKTVCISIQMVVLLLPQTSDRYLFLFTIARFECCRIETEKLAVVFPADLAIGSLLTFLPRGCGCTSVYRSSWQQSS